jgi:hypothetical protein
MGVAVDILLAHYSYFSSCKSFSPPSLLHKSLVSSLRIRNREILKREGDEVKKKNLGWGRKETCELKLLHSINF